MKIDIEPIIEKANEFDRICIDMREIEALYVARTIDGSDFTVKWEKNEMNTFCPNRTVSEMLVQWEEGLQRQYDTYMTAYKTKVHPYRKSHEKALHPITGVWNGKYNEVDYMMTKHEAEGFLRLAKQIEPKLGKLSFIKIC